MTKPKLYPYINRFTGDVLALPKKSGEELNEDWERGKLTKNNKGEKVFRFKLDASFKGKDGKTHHGSAIVDLQETEMPADGLEVVDGERNTK